MKVAQQPITTLQGEPRVVAWPRRRVWQACLALGQGAVVAASSVSSGVANAVGVVGVAGSAKVRDSAKQPAQPSNDAKVPDVPKPEKRSFVVAAANTSSLAYLPLHVAQHRGFFAQQGLDLEIADHQSTSRAMQAVSSGQADVLCGWMEHNLSPAGRALGLQSYALMGCAPMMALGVAKASAPVVAPGQTMSIHHLRGRMLGVVALQSPTHTLAVALLRASGLKAQDVRIVSVGSSASAAAALRSGQIDALMHMDPLMLQLEQQGLVSIVADLRSPQLCAKSLGVALPSSCLSATPDVLQRFPGCVQASSDAVFQALQWLGQASLRDVLQLLSDTGSGATAGVGMDAQLMVASWARLRMAFSPQGLCPKTDLLGLWQAMIGAEPTLRLEKADPARACSNAWMLRSAARVKA